MSQLLPKIMFIELGEQAEGVIWVRPLRLLVQMNSVFPWLGPVWSGIALGFPTTLLASAWMLYGHYGRTFGAATLNAAQPSLVVYASFVLALHLLTGPLPATVAVVVSFVGSALMAAGLAVIVSRRRRHSISP